MSTWRNVVLFVLLAQAVVCTPLDNQPSGAKMTERDSVKQTSDNVGTEKTLETDITQTSQSLSEDVKDVPEIAEITIDYSESKSAIDDVEGELTGSKEAIPEIENGKVDYTGAQVWEISLQKQGFRAVVNKLARKNLLSPWGGNQSFVDVMVKPAALPNVTKIMDKEKIPYEILIDNLQARINEENPAYFEYAASSPNGHWLTWKMYHGVDDIYGFMEYLAKSYPKLITVENIGKSFLGRDIKALRISNGKLANKKVFIDGGIHAREWISPATVTYFIKQFAENFDEESEDVKNIDWYFVPVINPDGYEYTRTDDRLWRKNLRPAGAAKRCRGADLNRNWGYEWGGKGSSNNPCSDIYRGDRAFSEPETQAVSEYIKANGPFSAYLSYHSYGQYILYPWGYDDVLPSDHEDMHNVGIKMAQVIEKTGGSKYSVGSSSGLLYSAAGGSDDWAKGQGIKYSYTVELSDTGRYGFILPYSYIIPVATESLAGLRVMAATVNSG